MSRPWAKGQDHVASPVSNWSTSFSLHTNQNNNSWATAVSKFDLENPRLRAGWGKSQCDTVSKTPPFQFGSIQTIHFLFHAQRYITFYVVPWFMSFRPTLTKILWFLEKNTAELKKEKKNTKWFPAKYLKNQWLLQFLRYQDPIHLLCFILFHSNTGITIHIQCCKKTETLVGQQATHGESLGGPFFSV